MMPGVSRGEMNGGYRDFEHGHLRSSSYANGYNPYGKENFGDFRPNIGQSSRSNVYDYARSTRSGYAASASGPPRRYNGADDLEHNSFEMREGRDPTYEVDHLATYTNKSGITNPEDGLTKLKQMESTTGIWTMRCSLIIERFHIVIIDKGNGDELERFPMANVYEPTAVLKNDNKETYNNLLLFTILDDPRRKNSSSDMHIFQSINAPAHNIVDEILRAKGDSGSRREPEAFIPPPPRVPAPEPPYIGNSAHNSSLGEPSGPYPGPEVLPIEASLKQTRLGDNSFSESRRFNNGRSTGTYLGGGGVLSQTRAGYAYRDDMDTGQNEVLERDVQLLNNCFDDIEKFVSRLQQAAEAYKELERRRNERGGGKKKKGGGDGMLMMRARPPPADDFVDIFQKFKFAFNLLAKLKAHIHDPNAPELVHFLFTPLSLIYEASRDPIHGGRDLSLEAVAPLLLPEAKQLLTNCLTSKELELWTRLGRPWTLVKNEWNGPVPNYNPRFYNGWTPSPQLVDEVNVPGGGFREDQILRTSERVPYLDARRDDPRRDDPYRDTRRDDPYSRREEPFRDTRREDPYRDTRLDGPYRDTRRDDPYRETARDDPYSRDIRREEPYRDTRQEDPRREPAYSKSIPRREEQDRDDYPTTSFVTIWEKRAGDPPPAAPKTRAELNLAFAQDLKRMGATIYEAGHERQGKNPKELTVEKGDILQVLDKSRNWWKLKNYSGESGYAPYTILKEYQGGDAYDHNPGDKRRLSGDYNSGFINGGGPPPAPPIMGGLGRSTNRNEESGSRQRRPSDNHPARPLTPPPVDQRNTRMGPQESGSRQRRPSDNHPARPLTPPPVDQRNTRMGPQGNRYTPELQNELRSKINLSNDSRSGGSSSPRDPPPREQPPRSPPMGFRAPHNPPEPRSRSPGPRSRSPGPAPVSPRNILSISQYTTSDEVRDWMQQKGFTKRTIDNLRGYSGLDLFNTERSELERLVGQKEGSRLDSLLELQKLNAGYRTRGRSELQQILKRRMEQTDTSGEADFGTRPSFMPETPPDYSPAESDASDDDLGNAGKTLRHLLERQRRKLHQANRGPYE